MKITLPHQHHRAGGYALIMVMGIIALSLIAMAATMRRTGNVALLNNRNNYHTINVNAAEAAVEKIYARMAYDFASYGAGAVNNNLGLYRTNLPSTAESSYWSQFQFSDAQGNVNRTYVGLLNYYSGPLPSQYDGLFTLNSPVYRIISNARNLGGSVSITSGAQVDVLLAQVPISTYAIFYNSLLEFSTAATMTVNGRVHANGNIYTGSSSPTTFNDTVTATGTLTAPANNGSGPWSSLGVFKGNPTYKTNVPTVALSINMTNTYSLIEMPPAGESPTSSQGAQRLYNQAHVILMVSNTTVTAKIQISTAGQIPGADTAPQTITSSTNISALATNFPFLVLTNTFLDQRENKTILASEIDVNKYGLWLKTNAAITTKFGTTAYPTILYAADNRANSSSQLSAIRLVNGANIPRNGGLGWSVATPNPLYVKGDYNSTNASYFGTTNTTAALPSAFMSDALTILSSAWSDKTSLTSSDTGQTPSSEITINAAILTGIVPSTGTSSSGFSGGVHNLPRLLENWTSSRKVWLNTSIINLYSSKKATGKFITPGSGSYYTAPTRQFSFDLNFKDANKQPPGMPVALVPIRYNWAVPPPGSISYNVVP